MLGLVPFYLLNGTHKLRFVIIILTNRVLPSILLGQLKQNNIFINKHTCHCILALFLRIFAIQYFSADTVINILRHKL